MKKIITAFAMLFCLCSALTFSACSSSDSDRIGELEQQIINLETQIENSASLEDELNKLKQNLDELSKTSANSSEISSLLERIVALEEKIKSLNVAQPQYEKLYLSSMNYSDYIAISSYFGDITLTETGLTDSPYRLFANYYIETYPCIQGIYFEDVEIHYAISIPTLDEYYPSPSTQLSYTGFSKCSVGTATFASSLADCYPSSDLDYITVVSVSGYVLVPQEA